jgi:hypothetical protein
MRKQTIPKGKCGLIHETYEEIGDPNGEAFEKKVADQEIIKLNGGGRT